MPCSGHSVWLLLLFSLSIMSNPLRSQGLQHTRLPCPSLSHGVWSNSCPLNQWCHPTISSSVFSFSSCRQYFPAPGSFPKSQLLASSGQSIRASATVLPMNIQGWFPLELTGFISLESKGLSRVFSSTAVLEHQFFFTLFFFQNCLSVTKSCPALCNPKVCSTVGFSVLHYLLDFSQSHVHWISDAIQPSHLLLPPFPPALSLSQHQGIF